MMSMSISKKILGTIWVIGFLLPFLLLIVMTVNNSLQDTTAAWGWFLPTMLPTVSLIVAVFIAEALNPEPHQKFVSGFVFWLACIFSVVYIGVVAFVAVDMPLSASATRLTEKLKNSNVYLGPMQGLLTGILGVFFVNRNTAQSQNRT